MKKIKMIKRLNLRNRGGEDGAALITAMIVLVAMTMLGFSLVTLSQIEFNISRNLSLAEEALFAAEEGVMTGVRIAEASMMDLVPNGPTIKAGSEKFTGKPWYPKWEVEVSKEGLAPQKEEGFAVEWGADKMTAFLYRIRATGASRPHTTRKVEALVQYWEKTGSYSLHVRTY